MSSILLGPLAQNKASRKLDGVYNSNISGKMNVIEQRQAIQNRSNPEFINQFDDLRFDNISAPVGVNEAFTTVSGMNTSLQRNLDFANGYSQFAHSDMHYDVVSKEDFVLNNMTPNTARRDFDVNSDRTQRKLETFTGAFEHYTPKKEKHHLFEPMADLTYTHGMPAITNAISNRFLPSNKNNYGNTPFETNVRVRPGLNDKNQQGNHAVYRIMPKNVDDLRSDINQKTTYEGRRNEAVKKGEFRGPDPNLTKFKLPDHRETKFDDLLPSKSHVDAPKQTGTYTNVTTMRNEKENYKPGHAVNTKMGDGPDKGKTRFEPSKRENYLNDNTHAINAVNNKPVMTNAKSFTAYENQRVTTNIEYQAPLGSSQSGYVIDYNDIPLTTARELMIHNDNILGPSSEQKSYVFSNDMVLPVTKRQTMDNHDVLGPTSNIKNSTVYFTDDAKNTQRQTTSYSVALNAQGEIKQGSVHYTDEAKMTLRANTSHNIVSNATGEVKQGSVYYTDEAKMTLRPGTSHNIVSNATGEVKQGSVYYTDEAKMTQRPGTSHNIVSNIVGEVKQGSIHHTDEAKLTHRQSTSHNLILNATSEVKHTNILNGDMAKPTIKQTTIINNHTGMVSSDNSSNHYVRDLSDTAKATIRQQTENTHHIGHASSNINEASYVRDLSDTAKTTIRQQTENTQHIGHTKSSDRAGTYVRDLSDTAKTTIRQQTENTQHIGHTKSSDKAGTYVRDLSDTAKTTLRQQTEDTQYIGHTKASDKAGTYIKNYNDIAKPTIKQTTIIQTPGGRVGNSNMGNYTDLMDTMRTTTKETTMLEDYTGGAHGEIEAPSSHEAANNMCIDDRREISTYSRAPNGKGDLNGPYIDRDNVRLNEPILFSYVPHPHKTLDHSVMPTTSRDTIEKVYSMSKPVIETSSYYVNPYFINTLKTNPLVNDIYHPKNV